MRILEHIVDHANKTVTVRFKDKIVKLAFDWFDNELGIPAPDFNDVQVTDGGNTLRLGDFEAASDALFYSDEDT